MASYDVQEMREARFDRGIEEGIEGEGSAMICFRCPKHPRYNGGREPKASCEACQWIWWVAWAASKPRGVEIVKRGIAKK